MKQSRVQAAQEENSSLQVRLEVFAFRGPCGHIKAYLHVHNAGRGPSSALRLSGAVGLNIAGKPSIECCFGEK